MNRKDMLYRQYLHSKRLRQFHAKRLSMNEKMEQDELVNQTKDNNHTSSGESYNMKMAKANAKAANNAAAMAMGSHTIGLF